jgi:phosphoribosyl 1,2-cyclic phosphodiesterase
MMADRNRRLSVRFWGTRGSIPCPGAEYVTYGGNTSCVHVQAGDRHLILDAGSGIRPLGLWLERQEVRSVTLLLSHTHWDHVCGFPFFSPAYRAGVELRICAGHARLSGGIAAVLAAQMQSPWFPVRLADMPAHLQLEDFSAGDRLTLDGGITVRSQPLRHQGGATGYRVEFDGRAVCYVTDTEHEPGHPDRRILELIEGADLVIYDSTYSDESFPRRRGWGHSTWQEGIRLCRIASARRPCLFHHAPEAGDAAMADLASRAARLCPEVVVAREGMCLTL